MKKSRDNPVARFVRNLIKERGWTQERLADQIGVDRSAVNQWSNGRTLPEPEHCIKLAQLAEVDAEELIRLRQAVALAKRGVELPTRSGDVLTPFEREHLMLIRDEKYQDAINQLVELLMQKHAA